MLQDNDHYDTLLNLIYDWELRWKGGKPPQNEIDKRTILDLALAREYNKFLAGRPKIS